MIASPLPDRDHRHLLQFYFAPHMDYGRRLAWAGSLIIAGLGVQVLGPFDSVAAMLIAGLPLLMAGNLFLLARGYNLHPRHLARGGRWEKTTRDRFAKLRDLESRVKRWDEAFTDITCASGLASLALVLCGLGFVWMVLGSIAATRFWAPILVADAAVLLIPHWVTGTRRGWRPVALRQQIDALETALAAIEAYETPPCQIQPMFEVVGKGDRQVPINARVFVRFPDGPESFLGVQYQVALNNVQGTQYPYLYAVLVARPEFGLAETHLEAIRDCCRARPSGAKGLLARLAKSAQGASTLSVEPSRESDVDVVVIRQQTTKQSGYHTGPAAISRIAAAAWRSAVAVVSRHSAVPDSRSDPSPRGERLPG